MLILLLKRNFDDTKIIKKSEWAMLHTCLFGFNPRYTIMYILNIPYTELKLELRDDKRIYVWDFIRRRWLKTTPEEWVRQQFSHWLTDILGYPKARLAHEISLEQNGMSKRADAVFYDKEGRPLIIFEFKAPPRGTDPRDLQSNLSLQSGAQSSLPHREQWHENLLLPHRGWKGTIPEGNSPIQPTERVTTRSDERIYIPRAVRRLYFTQNPLNTQIFFY